MSTARQRRLHVVSLPHTTLSERSSSCAYTMKHYKFCPMMLDQGCEVFSYGPDIVDDRFRSSEHVVITTQGDRDRWGFGNGFNTAETPFLWDAAQPYWHEPAQKAIDAIRERARPLDYLCLITGTQWPIAHAISRADCVGGPIALEYGVGYEGIFAPFVAFESHAWQNHVYGIRRWSNGRAFDSVIPNFFDKSQFYVGESEGYLLYMGRLVLRKGADIAGMIAKRTGRKLIVAGPGAKEWSKTKIVGQEGLEIEGDVEYVGEVGFAERAELMSKAAALLVPTKYVEPFGGVAVEAMMSGAPVLASDWGAFPELLTPAVGRTFRTPKQGAEALSEILSLDRQAIREYAVSRFSLEAVGPMFMRWWESLDTLWSEGFYELSELELNAHDMVIDSKRPWLGGYFPEGDPGSHCSDVWEWALAKFKIRSVIDVGCGAGLALDWFEEHGCEVLGVDGLPPPRSPHIVKHDYTTGPYLPERPFDLCWSCEFVEHVEEQFIPNFIATFQSARYLMMTHGLYWQDGHHHVNCQRPEYWIDRIRESGFTLLGRETIESRDRALQHYWKHSGLIFRNRLR